MFGKWFDDLATLMRGKSDGKGKGDGYVEMDFDKGHGKGDEAAGYGKGDGKAAYSKAGDGTSDGTADEILLII